MRHQHIPHRKRPPRLDVSKSRPKTPLVKEIERAFYKMLADLDDDAEELQEFTAGPRQKRWDD